MQESMDFEGPARAGEDVGEVGQVKVKKVRLFDNYWYAIEIEGEDGQKRTEYFAAVTTALNASPKPFLARWRGEIGNREADRRLEEACERGSRIHHAIYTYLDGGAVIYNPWEHPIYSEHEIKAIQEQHDRPVFVLRAQDEMWQVAKFQKWADAVRPVIVEKELVVYSMEHRVAGRIDYVLDIAEGEYMVAGAKPLVLPAGRYIMDVKSGKVVDDDAYLQTAAYQQMYVEDTKEEITGRLIVHTNDEKIKNGIAGLKTHYRPADTFDVDWEDFLHVKAIWHRKIGGPAPKIADFPSILSMNTERGEDDQTNANEDRR